MANRVNFQDMTGCDIKLIMALKAGKGYEAAARIAGMSVGAASYRATLARKLGMKVSPREYRNSSDMGNTNVHMLLRQIGQLDRTVKQINKHLAKHQRMVNRRKNRAKG